MIRLILLICTPNHTGDNKVDIIDLNLLFLVFKMAKNRIRTAFIMFKIDYS